MKYAVRIKFKRTGPVRYLGHLDMLRYFQKAVMRSGIDVKYSEGYNPHQIMSFAYPLGVSMETLGDYMDLELNSEPDTVKIYSEMNAVMNEGINVVSVSALPETSLNAMASVAAASYRIVIDGELPNKDSIQKFLELDHIWVKKIVKAKEGKKSKKSKDEDESSDLLDIRNGILSLYTNDYGELETTVKSGSAMNLKPSTLVNALSEYLAYPIKIEKVVRTEIYRQLEDESIVPLGDFHDQTKEQ